MSKDYAKFIATGRLGKDPETRGTDTGTLVCNFSIASGYKYKDKEHTEWSNIVAFGKLAEICSQYLVKGSQVLVECRKQTDKFQDRNTGEDRYSTKFILNELTMLGSSAGSGTGESRSTSRGDGGHRSAQAATNYEHEFDDSDVPF